MQIENYFEMLDNIENNMESLDIQTLHQLLEQTFEIKPVRLKWYLLKAQVMLKEGKSVAEIKTFLEDKCIPCYEYDGVEEYFQLLSALSEFDGDLVESQRYLYQLDKLKHQNVFSAEVTEELELLMQQMAEQSEICVQDAVRLSELFYITGNIYLYLLWVVVANKLFDANVEIRMWVLQKVNVEYFYERLTEENGEIFAILVTPNQDEHACALAKKALQKLNKRPVLVEDFQGAEKQLEEICEQYGVDIITVLGSGFAIDELAMSHTIKPKLERLTEAQYDYMEENMAVGRYGNYLSYMARVYKTTKSELEELLYRKPSCQFSIIIPCRNASDTLRYTLRTCLEQSFQGNYEVLISDNSDREFGEETPVFQMCQEMQDSRIRYIRTPRNLPLAKNFEYAYLHAEGEFLISMGSDDGILPWALEELDYIITEYPEQSILLWHEAFYKWADVDARIMESAGKPVLRVTDPYIKNTPKIYLYDAKQIFQKSFEQYGMLYYMPQLYHNCGIHRDYMQSLYEKCGVLWAGGQQDIYMAVVNANVQEQICVVQNMFTITGISNNSIGANARMGNTNYQQKSLAQKMMHTFYQGHRVPGYVERLFPSFGTELGALYAAVLCANAQGIIADEVVENADWKSMFERVIPNVFLRDVLFDRKWHWMRYVISLHGEELLEWFDSNYYFKKLNPVLLKIEDNETNSVNGEDTILLEGKEVPIAPHSIDDVYQVSLLLKEIYQA